MNWTEEIWQSLTDDPGILGKKNLLLDSTWSALNLKWGSPHHTTVCLRLLILFPLVLNSRAITFHKELKKTLLQELHDSTGWSYSRGNGNVNKQSEAISWSRARKGRELVRAGQVSGYIPWGRTLAAMHRRAGSYLEELQKTGIAVFMPWLEREKSKVRTFSSLPFSCLAWESANTGGY